MRNIDAKWAEGGGGAGRGLKAPNTHFFVEIESKVFVLIILAD